MARIRMPENTDPAWAAANAPTEPLTESKKEEAKEAPKSSWPELTPEEIESAKAASFGMPIYRFDEAGQTYVFRAIASHEWQKLLKTIIAMDEKESLPIQKQNEMICDLAVVWPPVTKVEHFWDRTLAGIAESLVLQIREKSGFPLTMPDGTPILDVTKVKRLTEDAPSIPEPDELALGELKHLSPNGQVYRAEFNDGSLYYYRPLMRNEWALVQQEEQRGHDSQEFAIRSVVLWSNHEQSMPLLAGVVEQLFEEILKVSGFNWAPKVTEL